MTFEFMAELNASEVRATAGSSYKISAGTHHTLAIDVNGTLWGWGSNNQGQLGQGVGLASSINPVLIAHNVLDCATSSHGSPGVSLFVKMDGSLWGMGRNEFGELGDGTTNPSKTPIKIIDADVKCVAVGMQLISSRMMDPCGLWEIMMEDN